ncbi:MAG TPA: choice-of-anchor D domain-containing protein [Kofleriaceae bacterium]|nr:choice-of-anchor D domain-containing protein [Kofleriaceae bacterium]
MLSGFFDLNWCNTDCETEGRLSVQLQCTGGWLSPAEITTYLPVVFAYEVSQAPVRWTNTGSDPVIVTGFSFSNSAFTAAPESGTLPRAVLPGESLVTTVTFDTTSPAAGRDVTAHFDVMAGAVIAGRGNLLTMVLKQILPGAWTFESVPQGAVYTLPLRIHNSSTVTRTINSVTSDDDEFTIADLVGTTLAPGAVANRLLTFTATTPGHRIGNITLEFDTGRGEIAQYEANVIAPPWFELVTADAVAGDGRLDFGTWRVDAPAIEKTFTIINHSQAQRSALACMGPGGFAPQFELVGECPFSIAPGGSVTLAVRLTPATVAELQEVIEFPLGAGEIIMVQLDARIVDHQLALSRSQVAFAGALRGDSARQTIAITNVAATPITVPIVVTGDAFALVGQDAITLAAGASADITVEFQPTTVGSYRGTLELGTTGDRDHVVVPLAGTARPPMVQCDTALELGDVRVGSTAEATLTVHSLETTGALAIKEIVSDNAEFAVTPLSDPVLGPDATISIAVQFTPTIPGPQAGQLSMFLDGDVTPIAVVDVTGNGLATGHRGGCNTTEPPGAAVALALALLTCLRGRRRGGGTSSAPTPGRRSPSRIAVR